MIKTKRHNPFPVIGPYSGIYAHGVEVASNSRVLYVSGQVGQDNDGRIGEDFESQCRQALHNVEAVLKEAKMTFFNIVKMNFYLTRASDMDTLVKVRKEMLDGVRPAITSLFVSGLVSPDWLVEVEVVAHAGQREHSVADDHS